MITSKNDADAKFEISIGIPPGHLTSGHWTTFLVKRLVDLEDAAVKEIKKLQLRLTKNQVHQARVAMRRWLSVGSLACCNEKAASFDYVPKRKLRKLWKCLGRVRDADVSLSLLEKLAAPAAPKRYWQERREEALEKLSESLDGMKPRKLLKKSRRLLSDVAVNSSTEAKTGDTSPYGWFDMVLSQHEEQVRGILATAATEEELHMARLAIKRWRYILIEVFGLDNWQLMNMQQVLGQIHDIDVVLPILHKLCGEAPCVARAVARRAELLQQYGELREEIPWGLRPLVIAV